MNVGLCSVLFLLPLPLLLIVFRLCQKELMQWISPPWTCLETLLVHWYRNLRKKMGNSGTEFLHSVQGERVGGQRRFSNMACNEWLILAIVFCSWIHLPPLLYVLQPWAVPQGTDCNLLFPGSLASQPTAGFSQWETTGSDWGQKEDGNQTFLFCQTFVGIWRLHYFFKPSSRKGIWNYIHKLDLRVSI